ncbi:aspartate kinase [Aquimarina sp. AD10]|uniref:Aspartokinase n=1 Tax=Aquimarina aggregata TaxID=1642818 RepID=A0A162DK96_9FLAO|nr:MULTISPECIES: aspartate kinase [Aquimarina]AXT58856.1 aspartate kinase [Aquimarina sp. AD10]KZS41698.1 aspartate kinase [Aquimarina aggregata]RKM99669.1 aspartate kinase [Aquimarina sp. AD10]
MKILKFGGTSVGSVENLNRVKEILISDQDKKIVVCSAMSGVTDQLVNLVENIKFRDSEAITRNLHRLEDKHIDVIDALIKDQDLRSTLKNGLSLIITEMFEVSSQEYSEVVNSRIITYGETILTYIFSGYLNAIGVSNVLLDAKEFMFVGSVENPSIEKVSKKLNKVLDNNIQSSIYITQGFVCRDENDEISQLKRGGSDYTATIIGAALNATEVQIWTDIDGLHNNDPRYVEHTHPIAHLTYNEAAELAYFGAKILHPQTVSPVVGKDIPVLLKNTFDPEASGTVISNKTYKKGLKAISAKDGITAIKIKSNRMLMAHGYLRRIFEVFDNYNTSIDMITTSEIAISLTIDDISNLDKIVKEIESYAEITVEQDHSIICIVGESVINDKNSYKLFEILNYIPVRMVSYGGSNNNISLLVDTKDKIPTLRFLNEKLFHFEKKEVVA